MIDATQLESAVPTLCLNVRDALPDGSHVTIETANRAFDAHAAREHNLPSGDHLSISVTDTDTDTDTDTGTGTGTGTGMSPETIERAFEPFHTSKPIGENIVFDYR